MGWSEVKRLQLEDAGLLGCYDKHVALWEEMAALADKQTNEYLANPLQADVVEQLLPALRVRPEFRKCIGGTSVRADKWYRSFAEYILHRQWEKVIKKRGLLKKEANDG